MFAAAGHRAFPEYPESDLNLVTLRFASGAIGKVVVAFGEPGPQDHTVRVSGRDGVGARQPAVPARRPARRSAAPADDLAAAAA